MSAEAWVSLAVAILSIVANILQRVGRKQLADDLRSVEGDALRAAALAAGVMRSVDLAKHGLPIDAVAPLVDSLRAAQEGLGVDARPALEAVRRSAGDPAAAVLDALRKAGAK